MLAGFVLNVPALMLITFMTITCLLFFIKSIITKDNVGPPRHVNNFAVLHAICMELAPVNSPCLVLQESSKLKKLQTFSLAYLRHHSVKIRQFMDVLDIKNKAVVVVNVSLFRRKSECYDSFIYNSIIYNVGRLELIIFID